MKTRHQVPSSSAADLNSETRLSILFDPEFRAIRRVGNLKNFSFAIEDRKDDIRKSLTFLYGLERTVGDIAKGKIKNFVLPVVALNHHFFSIAISMEGEHLCLEISEREDYVRQIMEKKQNQIHKDPFHWSKVVAKEASIDLDFTQGLLDTEGIIFYVLDKDGKYLQTNRYFQDLCELDENSIAGSTEAEILSQASLSKSEIKTEFIGPEKRVVRCEERFVRPDQEDVTFQMQRRSLCKRDGSFYAVASLGINISKLKNTERELARSNRDLEQFTYLASHDLQAPINRVLGFLGILKDEDDPADREFALSAIETSASRMKSLVRGFLSMATVGQKNLKLQEVTAKEILETALENLRENVAEQNIEVSIEIPKKKLVCDPGLILQVFESLLENAVGFQAKDRLLEISMGYTDQGDKHRFFVSDNGTGIREELRQNLFRVDKKDRRSKSGPGLGLAICHRIIEAHGGQIWVDSDGQSGSTFYFEWPKLEIKSKAA